MTMKKDSRQLKYNVSKKDKMNKNMNIIWLLILIVLIIIAVLFTKSNKEIDKHYEGP